MHRFNSTGRELSLNDVRVVLYSQVLVELSPLGDGNEVADLFRSALSRLENVSSDVWEAQQLRTTEQTGQLPLLPI